MSVAVDVEEVVGEITVVVADQVADLGLPGVDPGFAVIAVGVVGDVAGRCGAVDDRDGPLVAIAVPVQIGVVADEGQAVISLAVAVVVDPVAELGRSAVARLVDVVAVVTPTDVVVMAIAVEVERVRPRSQSLSPNRSQTSA